MLISPEQFLFLLGKGQVGYVRVVVLELSDAGRSVRIGGVIAAPTLRRTFQAARFRVRPGEQLDMMVMTPAPGDQRSGLSDNHCLCGMSPRREGLGRMWSLGREGHLLRSVDSSQEYAPYSEVD